MNNPYLKKETKSDFLEQKAIDFLKRTLGKFKNPAIMCSFGKDSLVVTHLALRACGNLPVIFHKEPFYPKKYRYANSVIEAWNLTVYDYPPRRTAIQQKDNEVEIIGYYDIGGDKTSMLPTGICDPVGDEVPVCGLHDIYLKPKGRFAYPWDCVVHGHKTCDVDPFYGEVPLFADVGLNVGTSTPVFPIRDWSHQDVWDYIEKHELPIHYDRYEKQLDGSWAEKADKQLNPDYFPACTACMRRDGGAVQCPRFGCEVSNVSKQLDWVSPVKPDYMKETS
jgi:3'-phosphoadenosine 5'-phosphosulfate sulfotransferase (PAPS reductase)/FAD synthetase